MSSILSLFDSTTISNSAVSNTVKYKSVAPSGTSHITYIPLSNLQFIVCTTTFFTTVPSASTNAEPTRFVPLTVGNRTFFQPLTVTLHTA